MEDPGSSPGPTVLTSEESIRDAIALEDYVDRKVPMLVRMFDKRVRGYRAIGYARDAAPLAYEALNDEPVVADDADALWSFDAPP